MATIVSVNVGRERTIPGHARMGPTGIFKAPRSGPVMIAPLGIADDCIRDARHHGGPDQAVYVYFSSDYAWWSAKLGRQLEPGTFGENLTVDGLASDDLAIGDRLVAGALELEVTAPRIPCNTLAARMDDSGFVKAFRDAERPGVYCRVIAEGPAAAGMAIAHRPHAGERVGVVAMFRACFVKGSLGVDAIERMLAAPIAARMRAEYEALIAARR